MTYDSFLLALAMWREARGEGAAGMIAVGCVIRNRVKDWQQSYRDVIVGKNQFTSVSVLGDPNTVLFPLENDAVFGLAQDVVEGTQPDTTSGAHYYANEKAALSDWYVQHVIQDVAHPFTTIIGRHTFRR